MSIQLIRHAQGEVSLRKPILLTRWLHHDFFWLHSGQLRMEFNGLGEQVLQSGQGLVIHPDTAFRGSVIGGACFASVQHFKVTSTQRAPAIIRGFAGKTGGWEFYPASEPDEVEALIDRALGLSQRVQTPLVQEMRVALLSLQLGELQLQKLTAGTTGGDTLRELTQYISANPRANLRVDEMAQRSGLSASHFRAVFKSRIGQTPGQYQRHIHMREAARLLRETDQPIKQIAKGMGFDELAHFYRSFASVHGAAPAAYRKARSTWA